MAEQPQNDINEISGETFVEVITLSDEDFQLKKEEYGNLGIRRIDKEKLKEEFSISTRKDCKWTIISRVKLTGDSNRALEIVDENFTVNNIIFVECKLPSIKFLNSNLITQCNNRTSLRFYSSEIVEIEVKNKSSIGNVFLNEDSKIGGIRVQFKSIIESIWINKSQAKRISIFGESRCSTIKISDNSETESLSIIKNSTSGSIAIHDYAKVGDLVISHESQNGKISITGNSCIKCFYIKNSITKNIIINGQSSTDIIEISNHSKTGEVNISEQSQTGDILFQKSDIAKFEAETIIASIEIEKSTVHNIHLTDCYIPVFNFKEQSETEAFFQNCKFNLIDITNTVINSDSSISFSSTKIFSCLMDQMTMLGNLYFRDVSALSKPFKLPDFATEQREIQYEEDKQSLKNSYDIYSSLFRITYSSIGKTEFIDSDLESFEIFEFKHSRINEIFVSGFRAPDNILISEMNKELSNTDKNEQLVSFYSQFSQVFENQGFIFNSVEYRSKAALHHQKVLLNKLFFETMGILNMVKIILEYFPFFLNRWSNNHGESWGRAVIFIGISTLILYHGYLFSLGYEFNWSSGINWVLAGYYFEFINPFRSFDFMKDIGLKMNAWTRFIDLLSRLIIGYGVYQFLTAFRKYKKK